jgi:hypothetical protein
VTLGRALFDLGRYGEARVEFERVLEAVPENVVAAGKLAEIAQRTRGRDAAIGTESAEALPRRRAADPVVAELEAWLEVIDQRRRQRLLEA